MELFTVGNRETLTQLNKLSFTIDQDGTDVGNVGTGEDTLYQATVPGGLLSLDGDGVRVSIGGLLGATGATKTLKFKVGGLTLTVYNSTGSSLGWAIEFTLIRYGSTSLRVGGIAIVGSSATCYMSAATVTLSSNWTITVTGEATNDNDLRKLRASIIALPKAA